jgi:hypothetical protein
MAERLGRPLCPAWCASLSGGRSLRPPFPSDDSDRASNATFTVCSPDRPIPDKTTLIWGRDLLR